MRDGAADYVQKPFTADELAAFARRLLLKRQTRLEAQRLPRVRVVAPALADTGAADEFCVPGGAFLSDGHAWARIEAGGQVRVGLDDFARKALGTIERVELPAKGTTVRRGEPLFTVHRGGRGPCSGAALGPRRRGQRGAARAPGLARAEPLRRRLGVPARGRRPRRRAAALRIGKPVVDWYQAEIARLRQVGGPGRPRRPAGRLGDAREEFFAGLGTD